MRAWQANPFHPLPLCLPPSQGKKTIKKKKTTSVAGNSGLDLQRDDGHRLRFFFRFHYKKVLKSKKKSHGEDLFFRSHIRRPRPIYTTTYTYLMRFCPKLPPQKNPSNFSLSMMDGPTDISSYRDTWMDS